LMNVSGSNLSPRTILLSTFSHRSRSVAYTRRKSVWYFRSPSVRSVRLGWAPHGPALTPGPITNRPDPLPWSVPFAPFSPPRRPHHPPRVATPTRPHPHRLCVRNTALLAPRLSGVGVEPVDGHVKHTRAQPLFDQPADEVELRVQAADPEPGPGSVDGLVFE